MLRHFQDNLFESVLCAFQDRKNAVCQLLKEKLPAGSTFISPEVICHNQHISKKVDESHVFGIIAAELTLRLSYLQGGYFIWIKLPEHMDSVKITSEALSEHKVKAVPGQRYLLFSESIIITIYHTILKRLRYI